MERAEPPCIVAVKGNRWRNRDATMVLVTFRHGLRASELVDLRCDQVDLDTPSCTSVNSRMAALRRTDPLARNARLWRLQRQQELNWPVAFTSERGTPFTERGFEAMVERAARLPVSI